MMTIKKRLYRIMYKTLFGRRILQLRLMIKSVRDTGSYYERAFYSVPEKKLLYISISKAGNTSIKASLYAMPEMEDYRMVHNAIKGDERHKSIEHINEFEDYYKFTFVRNPFDRLVSCYENKFHTDQTSVGVMIKDLIYDRYLMGYLGRAKGFKSFALRVCRIPDKIAERHFISQSFKMLRDDGSLIPDYVGKFENFQQDYEYIRNRFDLMPLPHYNHTKKEKENWMDYYDMETAQKVYKRYQRDIELFGYQDVYNSLIDYLKSKNIA